MTIMTVLFLAMMVVALSVGVGFLAYLLLYVTGQQDREAQIQHAAMEATDRLSQAAWQARQALWESAQRARHPE